MPKKVAVMIYPFFSLQEISCLTSSLTVWEEGTIDVFASSSGAVKSEDGFLVTANKTFADFSAEEYDCLLLPGILNPFPALFDAENIRFLQGIAGEDILVAAISSAPLLLAKAGLLNGRQYTSGVFDELLQALDFIPKEGIVRKLVHRDSNIITAVGHAYKEFAVEVLHALDISCRDDVFNSSAWMNSEEDLTFRLRDEEFREVMDMYRRCESEATHG